MACYFDPIIWKENQYFGFSQNISVWYGCHARKIHSFPCEEQFNKSGNFNKSQGKFKLFQFRGRSHLAVMGVSKLWWEFRSHYQDKLLIHLVKCTFDCQSGNFKTLVWLWQVSLSSCMLRTEKLITFNMTCMWTFHTNSLLHGSLFLMHVHK